MLHKITKIAVGSMQFKRQRQLSWSWILSTLNFSFRPPLHQQQVICSETTISGKKDVIWPIPLAAILDGRQQNILWITKWFFLLAIFPYNSINKPENSLLRLSNVHNHSKMTVIVVLKFLLSDFEIVCLSLCIIWDMGCKFFLWSLEWTRKALLEVIGPPSCHKAKIDKNCNVILGFFSKNWKKLNFGMCWNIWSFKLKTVYPGPITLLLKLGIGLHWL